MGYRRIHGQLAALGIKVAASTVWEILNAHGIAPCPQGEHTTWAGFLRSQDVLLACDFFETRTLTGAPSSQQPSTPYWPMPYWRSSRAGSGCPA